METQMDYYGTLGVEKSSPPKKIRDAYRKLALKYHPDRNPDPSAAARMKEINEAYAVLSDPRKRREYDLMREQFGASAYGRFRQSHTEQDIFRGSDIDQVFEEISRVFGFRSSEEVFKEFYGPGYRSYEFRRPGFSGRTFIYRGRSPAAGTGRGFELTGPLGRIVRYALKKQWGFELPQRGKDQADRITVDPDLARSGGKIRYIYRPDSREFVVSVPPGIREGQRIRLRGMGGEGKGGGEPGDLYITVQVRPPLLKAMREGIRKVLSGLSSWLGK